MFSATGYFGGPGQINHAAANSFMDELTSKDHGLIRIKHRLGTLVGSRAAVGYADGDSLRAIPGIRMIDPEQGMHLMDALWNHTKPTVTVIPMDSTIRLETMGALWGWGSRRNDHQNRSSHRFQ